ncbi:MAG: hypothetical protein U1D30_15135 [Planctomycetota bacterium]
MLPWSTEMYSGRGELRLSEVAATCIPGRIKVSSIAGRFVPIACDSIICCQEMMDLTAPLPEDFERTLAALRQYRSRENKDTK